MQLPHIFWKAVKPAFKDVNVGNFLAFCPAVLKTKLKPSSFFKELTSDSELGN